MPFVYRRHPWLVGWTGVGGGERDSCGEYCQQSSWPNLGLNQQKNRNFDMSIQGSMLSHKTTPSHRKNNLMHFRKIAYTKKSAHLNTAVSVGSLVLGLRLIDLPVQLQF
jgi:hypothetical protein